MNKFKVFIVSVVVMAISGFCTLAFASDLPVAIPSVTNPQFIEALLTSIGGWKGASTLAIISSVLQLIFKALGTPMFGSLFNKMKAQAKFLIVGILSIATLTVTQMVGGMEISAALLHSTVVTALMNYVYRFYELFVEKKN